MWNRKELKKNALHVIKRNLWTILFVVFFMSIVFKEYSITRSSNGSIDTINRILVDIENGEDVKILEESETGGKQLTEYADEVINLALFGSKEGTITNINDKFDITHGSQAKVHKNYYHNYFLGGIACENSASESNYNWRK